MSSDRSKILIYSHTLFTAAEVRFWKNLNHELKLIGWDLVLTAHLEPPENLGFAFIQIPATAEAMADTWGDFCGPSNCRKASWLDGNHLLDRERLWFGPERNQTSIEERKLGFERFYSFYTSLLAVVKPVFTVIWNGEQPQEMILAELARQSGSAIKYMERGFLRDTLFLDSQGISRASEVALREEWGWSAEKIQDHWLSIFDRVRQDYLANKQTWWEQPEETDVDFLKHRLGIKENAKVVLFLGQIDNDTSCFLFSPHFKSNIKAFEWFCQSLDKDEDVFILGKHHPRSTIPMEDYQKILGNRGVWTSDICISDCLSLADRVACVNSTGLYEALLREKPVLTLGHSLLSKRDITYEMNGKVSEDVVRRWLSASDFSERLLRWYSAAAYLLENSIFSMREGCEKIGLNGTKKMAHQLIKNEAKQVRIGLSHLKGVKSVMNKIEKDLFNYV